MQAFTDLVGTTVVPTRSFASEVLAGLAPSFDTATVDHDIAVEASDSAKSAPLSVGCSCPPIMPD